MLLLLLISTAFTFELPHGVPSTNSELYRVGKPFSCLDGSFSISWTKVNDDYCDCADGSDEPGTSACRRGVFFCKDTQYKHQPIRSAYVQDGYCDCCDGSDEYGSSTTCVSNCGTLAAADQQARTVKRNEIEEGHKLFKHHVELLKIERAKREQERLDAERAAAENQSASEPPSSTEENAVASDTTSNESVNQDDHVPPSSDEHPDIAHDENQHINGEELGDSVDMDHREEAEPHDSSDNEIPEPEPKDYGPEGIFQVLDDMDHCLQYSDQQYTYELCGLKEVYQREGSDSGYKTSLGKWAGWDSTVDDTSSENKYSVMNFKHGLTCWNGPARSTKVYTQCGPSNEILSVTEPSRCEYVMILRTFAACFEDPDVLFNRLHPDD